jgi:hypothetical protein
MEYNGIVNGLYECPNISQYCGIMGMMNPLWASYIL